MTATPPDPDQPFGANQPPYPGAQPAAGSYGSYPTDPATAGSGASPQRPSAPEQPASIAMAVKLMLVGAGLSVLSLIYSLTTIGDLKDDVREQLLKDDANVSQSTIDAGYAVAIGFLILFGLVGAVLWAWMAWKNGQGRSWARVVATVFAALNVLGVLFTGTGAGVDTISLVLSIIGVVLAIVVLVLLWRKESSAFYAGAEASRKLY
nr:hypothetical protein [Aeromicrobium sp.]